MCVLVCLVLVVTVLPQCNNAQAWETLAVAIAEKLVELWQHGEVRLLNHQCNYSVTPKVRSWELYYQGSMWCPGWTPIRGEALTRSRSGVVGKTTQDFVRKAFTAGLITEQEGKDWLVS
ncbi:anti-lipopolysaccharide factor-like [Procambarus clarkii]|uniref:ALF5 n=1 Tax=Procambarus clarkii TaxID=6728 RepID=A0A1S5RQT2_PROCL|nr:ALF5 [Procambarus clarkii]